MSWGAWLETFAYTAIIGILLWKLTFLLAYRYRDQLRESLLKSTPYPYKTDQPWRKPSSLYVKRLKDEIERKEPLIRAAEIDALICSGERNNRISIFEPVWFLIAFRPGEKREVSRNTSSFVETWIAFGVETSVWRGERYFAGLKS